MSRHLYMASFYALLLLFLAAQAGAYASLDISAGRCSDDGSFSMEVKNFGDSSLDLHEVRVTATKLGRTDDTFEITGAFDRTTLYEGSSYTTTTMFQSNTGNLNESGTYEIEVTYPQCRYGTCKEKMTLERCPGFPYQCKLADLQIPKCFERNGAFLIYFNGINGQQYEKIAPLPELAFTMKSNSRTVQNARYPAGAAIKTIGNDEYIMSVPLQSGEHPYETSLELVRCSNPPSFRELAICSVPEHDPNNKDLTVTEHVEPILSPAAELPPPTMPKQTPELNIRAGQNKVTGHMMNQNSAPSNDLSISSTLITSITIGIIILWIAATLLVTTLLIRSMKKL